LPEKFYIGLIWSAISDNLVLIKIVKAIKISAELLA
jgi:hypothetical protein